MSTSLIEVTNLTKKFKDEVVIKDLTITIEKGKNYILTGNNGTGKTTFLKILLGVYKPTSGKVKRNFKTYSYSQEQLIYKHKIKVSAFLNSVTRLLNVKRDKTKEAFFKLQTDKYLNNLSKGNMKKILLYISFIKDVDIIFLDEPFDGLDINMQDELTTYINNLNDVCLIISSHNKKMYENIKNKEVINFD